MNKDSASNDQLFEGWEFIPKGAGIVWANLAIPAVGAPAPQPKWHKPFQCYTCAAPMTNSLTKCEFCGNNYADLGR